MGELIAGLCFVLYGSGLALLVSRLGRKTLVADLRPGGAGVDDA